MLNQAQQEQAIQIMAQLKREHRTLQQRMALRAAHGIQAFESEERMFKRIASKMVRAA